MILFISVEGFLLLLVLLDADATQHLFGRPRALIRTGRAQHSKLTHSMVFTFRGRHLSSYPSSAIIDDNEHEAWIKRNIFKATRRLLQQERRRIISGCGSSLKMTNFRNEVLRH